MAHACQDATTEKSMPSLCICKTIKTSFMQILTAALLLYLLPSGATKHCKQHASLVVRYVYRLFAFELLCYDSMHVHHIACSHVSKGFYEPVKTDVCMASSKK